MEYNFYRFLDNLKAQIKLIIKNTQCLVTNNNKNINTDKEIVADHFMRTVFRDKLLVKLAEVLDVSPEYLTIDIGSLEISTLQEYVPISRDNPITLAVLLILRELSQEEFEMFILVNLKGFISNKDKESYLLDLLQYLENTDNEILIYKSLGEIKKMETV